MDNKRFIINVMVTEKLVASVSQAKRLVAQQVVTLDGELVSDIYDEISPLADNLKVGKRTINLKENNECQ